MGYDVRQPVNGTYLHLRCAKHKFDEEAEVKGSSADYRCDEKGCTYPACAYWMRGEKFQYAWSL